MSKPTIHRLALGLYRPRKNLHAQIIEFCSQGGYILDSAPNYAEGHAFQAINKAISLTNPRNHPLRINSKCGFLQNSLAVEECMGHRILSRDDLVGNHALTPDYIKWQVSETLTQLGCERLDTLFLHNPERQLERLKKSFWRAMTRCIEVLEGFVQRRLICNWGVSSWSGFAAQDNLPGKFTVSKWNACAESVAGTRNNFAAIQLPISLVNNQAVADVIFASKGPLHEARLLSKEVFASSCLHGGQLPKAVSKSVIRAIPGAKTPGQACLLYSLSAPGVSTSIISPSNPTQLQDLMVIHATPPIPQAVGSLTELLTCNEQRFNG